MVDVNNPLINFPLVEPPQFNQFMGDEELIKDFKTNSICRLFYNLDLERIGGNENVS